MTTIAPTSIKALISWKDVSTRTESQSDTEQRRNTSFEGQGEIDHWTVQAVSIPRSGIVVFIFESDYIFVAIRV